MKNIYRLISESKKPPQENPKIYIIPINLKLTAFNVVYQQFFMRDLEKSVTEISSSFHINK